MSMRNGQLTTADWHHGDDFDHAHQLHDCWRPTSPPYHRPDNIFHSLMSIIYFDSPTLVPALGLLVNYLCNVAFRLEESFTHGEQPLFSVLLLICSKVLGRERMLNLRC